MSFMKRTSASFISVAVMFIVTGCGGGTSAHAGRSSAALAPGQLASDSTLVSFAKELGCTNPSAQSATDPILTTAGITSLVQCIAGPRVYLLMRSAKAGQAERYLNDHLNKVVTLPGASYVSDANWVALGRVNISDSNPLRAQAEEVQRKLGGKVTTLP